MIKYSIGIILLAVVSCTPAKQEKVSLIKTLESPAQSGSEEPFLFTDEAGTVYLSWVETMDSLTTFKFSFLTEDNWSTPKTIASGTDWFVNWADYPTISVNTKNEMIAHFLAKSGESTYAYDVNITTSDNGGDQWNEAFVLHNDGKQAEHGFATLLPYGDDFFVTWLDGRNTVSEVQEGHEGHEGHGAGGPMTVRAAIVKPNGDKIKEWELDSRVCDCCQTTAAITANGPIVVYRDRSEDEIRDMSIVRLVDDQWTTPTIISVDDWKIAGCPVNGPMASVIDNSLSIAWFSAPEGVAQVNVVFSVDGGASFTKPVRLDSGAAIGRVDVELLDKNTAFVSWMEGTDIKGTKVTAEGKVGEVITLASSSASRASGFPQIARKGDQLVLAWTDASEEGRQVKTVLVRI